MLRSAVPPLPWYLHWSLDCHHSYTCSLGGGDGGEQWCFLNDFGKRITYFQLCSHLFYHIQFKKPNWIIFERDVFNCKYWIHQRTMTNTWQVCDWLPAIHTTSHRATVRWHCTPEAPGWIHFNRNNTQTIVKISALSLRTSFPSGRVRIAWILIFLISQGLTLDKECTLWRPSNLLSCWQQKQNSLLLEVPSSQTSYKRKRYFSSGDAIVLGPIKYF